MRALGRLVCAAALCASFAGIYRAMARAAPLAQASCRAGQAAVVYDFCHPVARRRAR